MLEQNLLSGILQSSLVLPLIASNDNDNDGDNDIQGVPNKTLFDVQMQYHSKVGYLCSKETYVCCCFKAW